MELKFIWIDDYTVLEKFGVNFNHSGQHRFQYQDEILNLMPNPKLPITFGENVTSVTAIAGENGSGKSSLCEAILFSVATYTGGSFGFKLKFKGIVCYGDHIFIYEKLVVHNTEHLRNSGYVIVNFKESPFEEMKHEWRDSFARGGFIYYSNILDYRTDLDQTNLANISTLASLGKSLYYSTSYPKLPLFSEQTYEHRDKDKHGPLQIHYNVEGNRIVKFYLNHHDLVPFVNVRHFIIKNTYSGNNRWLDLDKIKPEREESFYLYMRRVEEVENIVLNTVFDKGQEYDERTRVKINTNEFKRAIKLLYRYNLLVSLSILDNTLPVVDVVHDFVFSSRLMGYEQLQNEIAELLELHDLIVDKSSVLDEEEFSPRSLDNYFEGVKDWRFYLIENYYLANTDENRPLLLKFANLERKVLEGQGPLRRITNFNVTPLSSGENSLLTFFARIHDVIERYAEGFYDKSKLILFLDEPEIGFHPAWKRTYFNKLLHFLNNHFRNYQFQLIITTHSPYLLSDLPRSNVILLKKGADGKSKLLDSKTYKTFGGNIHELLGTSFFLEDGYVGEFAKGKIEEFISFLNGENNLYDKASAKEFISLIGDEIISNRLSDMYHEKFREPIPVNDQEYEQWLLSELNRIQLKDE
ncbi:AAA ATPase domain-containing protein [Cnuella takakiae]|uniref:AAA ATPase domain-containing protein n=1 Tax=Cnuella takakiae TaxID=1302690 RepID=A0A1M4TMR5_9BACT|nr:AAA family ATPase [Cnuella takakiae]OLY90767.1 hypothetical protein BUE76_01770 [Cnuella takakiae]SHE45664.1 AAA ATPase domain-containing protein [Cnuella takakiae]